LITKQIAIENTAEKEMSEQEKKVDTVAAKLLLLEVRLDSYKHAKILEAILNVMGERTEPLWESRIKGYTDSLTIKKRLEKHIEQEKHALQQIEEVIKETKDEAIKLLLQHILEDEKKHHKIFETIIKKAYMLTP
jgi:rubrerythrin